METEMGKTDAAIADAVRSLDRLAKRDALAALRCFYENAVLDCDRQLAALDINTSADVQSATEDM